VRDVFVPLEGHGGMTKQGVHVEPPPSGIVIYRFEESFLYPNASHINDRIIEHVKATTRHGSSRDGMSKGDRPWNDPAPTKAQAEKDPDANRQKPRLRAVVLDFQAVANLDTTGVQNLIDTRREVEKWADRKIEFHFTGILSPWIRRALIAGGFGRGQDRSGGIIEVAPVVPPHDAAFAQRAEPGSPTSTEPGSPVSSASSPTESLKGPHNGPKNGETDLGKIEQGDLANGDRSTGVSLLDRSTPFFHFDLADAIHSLEQ